MLIIIDNMKANDVVTLLKEIGNVSGNIKKQVHII